MRRFGLIGFPLGHSFSKKYFSEKFEQLGIAGENRYELLEMERIADLPAILKNHPDLVGLNVTIPHKINVLPFLSEIDAAAKKIGAVNVIKVKNGGKLKGFNSDFYGFKRSLEEFLDSDLSIKALVLGTGGASKSAVVALEHLKIPYKLVSRSAKDGAISYEEANGLLEQYRLIINCTPLGTFPKIETFPEIDYQKIGSDYYLYDLVYNPEETEFMKKGVARGAKVENGYKMLVYQAEKSWEIWNNDEI